MRAYLFGILSAAMAVLILIILYIGLIAVTVSPGESSEAGAFAIRRVIYFDAPEGRLYPAQVVSDTGVMTYTFTVSK
jgi:hypothetical protein